MFNVTEHKHHKQQKSFNPFAAFTSHHKKNSTHHSDYKCPISEAVKKWHNYSKWGRLSFVDENGLEIDTHKEFYNTKKSTETNHWLKWYEEKTDKYLTYEAAAKKFMLEEEYENRGKCPIMSFLTSESQIDAKMNEP